MENPYLQSRVAVWGSKGCLGPRDTRPIAGPWQREKSVKMMKSSTGERRVFGRLVIPPASSLLIVLKLHLSVPQPLQGLQIGGPGCR